MSHSWSHDDDLLVIDLYIRHGALTPDRTEVRTVARLIGTTPESVSSALRNVQYLDTGRGMANYADHMRVMWEEWGGRPDDVSAAATDIRRRVEDGARGSRPAPTPEQQARVEARLAERRRDRGR